MLSFKQDQLLSFDPRRKITHGPTGTCEALVARHFVSVVQAVESGERNGQGSFSGTPWSQPMTKCRRPKIPGQIPRSSLFRCCDSASFLDSAHQICGPGRLRNRLFPLGFCGELSSLPSSWDADGLLLGNLNTKKGLTTSSPFSMQRRRQRRAGPRATRRFLLSEIAARSSSCTRTVAAKVRPF